MALDQSALLELLAQLKLTDVTDRIRSATETLCQELNDAEATAFIGASPFERTSDRTTHRNGARDGTESPWVCWRFHTLETRMESWTNTTGQVEGIRLRRKLPRFGW
jgi:hypothetical protein